MSNSSCPATGSCASRAPATAASKAAGSGDTVEEVAHPLCYVSLTTKTLRPVTLPQYANAPSDVMATVPIYKAVAVVIQQTAHDQNDHLVRMRFELVGCQNPSCCNLPSARRSVL